VPRRRSPGDGALYFDKAKKLWRGVVNVGFTNDGRRKQKAVTSRTRSGARDKLDRLKDEIEQFGAPLDSRTTVEAWSTHWLETVCRPKLKPQPLMAYQSIVRNWIIPTIGTKRITLLKPSDVRAVYLAITGAGRSSATALKAHNIMSAMFESARLDGVIGYNVLDRVEAPRVVMSNRGALTSEQALRVLAAASSHIDGTRWWVALLNGLRQGERLGATLDSINFDTGEFTVQWSLTEAKFEHGCDEYCGHRRGGSCPQRRLVMPNGLRYRQLEGRLCLVPPKSGQPRTFPLIPPLVNALERYLQATKERPNPHGLIWRNLDGSPLTAKQDNQLWRRILFEAEIISEEQIKAPKDRKVGTLDIPTTHWARHTTATVLMELGVDARIIGEIIGHVSDKITRRYQHVSTDAARDAMSRLGAHFSGALEERPMR